MKASFIILLLATCCYSGYSQTFSEWFKQNKTQKKYLLQQIAALQLYIGYLEKGYQIADKGLTLIGDIKNGHFSLDSAFFNGLAIVSPSVKRYEKVGAIISLQVQTLSLYKTAVENARQSNQYTDKELAHINKVFTSLMEFCTNITDELISVTSDHVLQLSDDERLQRIDKLYLDMSDCFVFATGFKNECAVMALQRAKEKSDALIVGKLHGVPE